VTHALILPPAPVPYREPLFAGLAAVDDLDVHVTFLAPLAAGWDMAGDWYAAGGNYPASFLEARQHARSGRAPVVFPKRLRSELERRSPDVVVAWEFGPAALIARAWCTQRRRPLVHFSELGAAAAAAVPVPQRAVHRALARVASGGIGASSQARDRLVALGIAPARAFVSLQSVDADAIRAAAAGRTTTAGPLRLLSVGRLVPDKAHALLIDAVAAAGSPVALTIVGDGPLRAELAARARDAGVDATLTGALGAAALAEAYADADAFALISSHEPFGVAIREAVAAGLPLIVSRVAGAAGDVAVDGRNAVLVDPGDIDATAAAIRALGDPARRADYSEESRAIDRSWPLERSVEGFAAAIRAVV
jgi:glycosyltransferase involved in cell wall biosynthesis